MSEEILQFRPIGINKRRPKTLETHMMLLATEVKALQEGDETARNRVTAQLTALYWKFGRDVANEAMDTFRLGRNGFKRYDL